MYPNWPHEHRLPGIKREIIERLSVLRGIKVAITERPGVTVIYTRPSIFKFYVSPGEVMVTVSTSKGLTWFRNALLLQTSFVSGLTFGTSEVAIYHGEYGVVGMRRLVDETDLAEVLEAIWLINSMWDTWPAPLDGAMGRLMKTVFQLRKDVEDAIVERMEEQGVDPALHPHWNVCSREPYPSEGRPPNLLVQLGSPTASSDENVLHSRMLLNLVERGAARAGAHVSREDDQVRIDIRPLLTTRSANALKVMAPRLVDNQVMTACHALTRPPTICNWRNI